MNKYAQRVSRLQGNLENEGIDALYITNSFNVSYFTGTNGGDINLYITSKEAFIITDFRYEELAQSLDWFTFYETSLSNTLEGFLGSRKEKIVGIEGDKVSIKTYFDLQKTMAGSELKLTSGIVENLRRIKDEDEIAAIAKAEEIGDLAFADVLKIIKVGMTEKELAAELEYSMRKHGADGTSFSTISICGENTSKPHGVPGFNKIENGQFITMDFGCRYDLYCSDMTRTVVMGKPTDEMVKVYNTVLKANLAVLDQVKAGMRGCDVHKIAADIIDEAGYQGRFGHGLGHGVGLQIHEAPRFSPAFEGIIEENTVLSDEPGIYLPGKFGVRIEDLIVVKKDGYQLLSHSPKELICL